MKSLFVCGITLALAGAHAFGQGSVKFVNTSLSRTMYHDVQSGTTVPAPVTPALVYAIFINGSTSPKLPLVPGSTTTAGIIDGGAIYLVEGTVENSTVSAQIRAWAASYGADWQAARLAGAVYGETDVRTITLGGTAGPGAVLWQSQSGVDPSRFKPITVSLPLGLEIADITVAEGSNGVVNAVFTVSMSAARPDTVTVDFATQDGTAVAGQDYTAAEGTLSFAPGEVSKTITVVVTADGPAESDESFSIVLSDPVNTTLRKSTATCLITEARIGEVRIDTAIVFHTVAGRRYAVEYSTDMTTWNPITGATDVPGTGGDVTVHDKGAGCSGSRVYRTRLLTP